MIIPIQILANPENVTFLIPLQNRTETVPAYIAQNSTTFAIVALGEDARDLSQGKEPLKTEMEQHTNGNFYVTQPFQPTVFETPLIVAFVRYYLMHFYFDFRKKPIERYVFSAFDRYDCGFSVESIIDHEDNMNKLIQEFKNQHAILNIKRLHINGRKIW